MSDLSEFLLARIAEDETVAREAVDDTSRPGTHWHWVDGEDDSPINLSAIEDGDYVTGSLRTVEEFPSTYGPLPGFAIHIAEDVSPGVAIHIARLDPARVLAECDAKRRIVESWRTHARLASKAFPEDRTSSAAARLGLQIALEHLALPYADHPDYRPEWRP